MKINPQGALNVAITGTAVAYAVGEHLTCLARQRAAGALLEAAAVVGVNKYIGRSRDLRDGKVSGRVLVLAPSFAEIAALSVAAADGLAEQARKRIDAKLADAAEWGISDEEMADGLDALLREVFAEQAKSDTETEES